MRQLILILAIVLCALPATAQDDTIGMYFDPDAFSSIMFMPANTPFQVYVAITWPSAVEVHGLEFAYEILVEEGDENKLVRLQTQLPPQAINFGDDDDLFRGEYIVGLGTPLPGAEVVNFVVWTMMILDYMPVYFTMGPIYNESIDDGLPAYEAGGTTVPLWVDATVGFPSPVLGGSGYPFCACLNGCEVATEAESFGAVKAIYR